MIPIEDLTDVTLAIEDISENLRIFQKSENDDNDESYQVMEVIKWWKLSSDESYLVMKVI